MRRRWRGRCNRARRRWTRRKPRATRRGPLSPRPEQALSSLLLVLNTAEGCRAEGPAPGHSCRRSVGAGVDGERCTHKDGQTRSDAAWDIAAPGATHSQRERPRPRGMASLRAEQRPPRRATGTTFRPRSRAGPRVNSHSPPALAGLLAGRQRSQTLLLLFNRNNNNYSEK